MYDAVGVIVGVYVMVLVIVAVGVGVKAVKLVAVKALEHCKNG